MATHSNNLAWRILGESPKNNSVEWWSSVPGFQTRNHIKNHIKNYRHMVLGVFCFLRLDSMFLLLSSSFLMFPYIVFSQCLLLKTLYAPSTL